MNTRSKLSILTGLITLAAITTSQAQQVANFDIPRTISYQGILTTSNGVPVADGKHNVAITLYGNEAGTEVVWQDAYEVSTTGGIFNIYIGDGKVPLPNTQAMNRPLWIGTRVNGADEMRPLTLLASSPYALNIPNESVTTEKIADKSVTADKMNMDYISNIYINKQKLEDNKIMIPINERQNLILSQDRNSKSISIQTTDYNQKGTGSHFQTATSSVYWSERGNYSTNPSLDYVGTSDNQPFHLRANATHAMHFSPNGSNTPNIIGGSSSNTITSSSIGSVIGGGGQTSEPNDIQSSYSAISGGAGNNIEDENEYSVISGGNDNKIYNNTSYSGSNSSYNTISGGIHNKIGDNDNGTVNSFIGGGNSNQVLATSSTISGGEENIADGYIVSIGGGKNNSTFGDYPTISGGHYNTINSPISSGKPATISGGGYNKASGNSAVVAGGLHNHAIGEGSFIGGGGASSLIGIGNYANIASGDFSTIAGGYYQTNDGDYSVISGGRNNNIESANSSILGGSYNTITNNESEYSTVGGGENNSIGTQDASAKWATLSGGHGNQATADYTVIAGGNGNKAMGHHITVSGGKNNSAQGNTNTISGGQDNTIVGQQWSTIGGGMQNKIDIAGNATISGGLENTIASLANTAAIGGGYRNTITAGGVLATIPGGQDLIAQSYAQTVLGTTNIPKGSIAPGFTVAKTDQYNPPILIIGNGNGIAQSNAFEVSYNGHSVVYDENGTGGYMGLPGRAAIDGATYTDNIIYGWAEVAANASPGSSCGDFGIKSIAHQPNSGVYRVTLNMIGADGNPANISCGSVTATLGTGAGPTGTWSIPATIRCAQIWTSSITNNVFEVYITQTNNSSSPHCNLPIDLPFKFHVTGRVTQ